MKRIVSFLAALLHIVCNADSVTMTSSQQSWNVIASDNSTKIDHQSTNSTRTVYVANAVTFSTQHKHSRCHSSAPLNNLHHMSTEQLAWYFSAHGYTEGEVLSHPMLYMNAAYLALAKQLPRYSEFVKKYYGKYRKYKGLYKLWETIHFRYRKGMRKQFARLHWECVEQQRAKESHERKDHEERMRKEKVTAQYCAQLDALPNDKFMLSTVPYHHQAARKSTHAQIRTTAADRFTKNHTITHDTITFGQTYDISEHNLVTMHGNAYEQQLHSEFLEQLTEAHTICTAYSLCPNNILIDAVEHGIAIGMEANRLQKPAIATAWANFGWKALDLLQAAGEGLLLSVENTANMLLHPKNTLKQVVHGLGSLVGLVARTCAYTIGTAAYWHELMEHGDGLLMAQEMDSVAHQAKRFGAYCLEQAASLEAREVVKHGATIAADILLTHKMFTLGGRLCAELKPIFMDIIKAASTEQVSVELALQGAEEFGNARKISLFMEETEANSAKNISKNVVQLSESFAESVWTSKGGLIYGPDKKFGTRINHILQHTTPNPSKLNHTVFTLTGDELFDLIDFAWSKRGIPLADDPGTYIIELEKIIGTQGEKAIKIVVIPETNQVITAYPIKV